jgi:hypothetical protein
MLRKQLIPVVLLVLCGVVIAYGFVHALSATDGMPIGLLIAAPAILVGRLAWRRLALPKDAQRN